MRCRVRLTFSQRSPWGSDFSEMLQNIFWSTLNYLTPKKFQLSQFLSNWEPSEIYISLSFLYKFQTVEAYTLNIDNFLYIFCQDEALGQVDIWLDCRSGWHLVRCTPRWGFGSGWHLVRLQVRLTFGQMNPQGRDFSEMVQKYFWIHWIILPSKKISTWSIFKQLRAIWNSHCPIIFYTNFKL